MRDDFSVTLCHHRHVQREASGPRYYVPDLPLGLVEPCGFVAVLAFG